ncbi:hypothetical protein SAY86_005460 [Trapa natans]|uniref:Uncharacterized protein n=1 Tax=Trapa natans TaxID=22666 RepID=A0AAN7L022_TRANT|nr:hypothetical protein SAY86_005460 [Trapa natans]
MSGEGGGGSDGSSSDSDKWMVVPQPTESFIALRGMEREDHWSSFDFDDSINDVSFEFVATAILISMFLHMVIFEKFIQASSAVQRPMTQTVAHTESDRSEFNGMVLPNLSIIHFSKNISCIL